MSFRLLDIATFSSTWVTEKARPVRVVVAKKERIQYVSLSPPFVNLSYKLSVFFLFFVSFFVFSFFLSIVNIPEEIFETRRGRKEARESWGRLI